MMRTTDVSIVIPTHGRPGILRRTLGALKTQTVKGFDVTVVVDGTDQPVPDVDGVRVLVQQHAGPGAARNRGAAATRRPLLLFLGDDMVPTPGLVEEHVAAHERFRRPHDAVLGHVDWHPEVRRSRILRWLDWSTTQFDYASMNEQVDQDVGFARFYSCNVSLRRTLFEEVGGFDEDFVFYYEDLDAGYRLGEAGMRLRYVPGARVHHLHDYDLAAIQRRFAGIALGERVMAAKHPWFHPWFHDRIQRARDRARVPRAWPWMVDLIPRSTRMRALAERRANTWYHQYVAATFLDAWDRSADAEDLCHYLGTWFDGQLLAHPERGDPSTEVGSLHVAAAAGMRPETSRLVAIVASRVQRGQPLLDAGADSGSVGIRLAEGGHDVQFLRPDDSLADYVHWRLQRRGLPGTVHRSLDGCDDRFALAFAPDRDDVEVLASDMHALLATHADAVVVA